MHLDLQLTSIEERRELAIDSSHPWFGKIPDIPADGLLFAYRVDIDRLCSSATPQGMIVINFFCMHQGVRLLPMDEQRPLQLRLAGDTRVAFSVLCGAWMRPFKPSGQTWPYKNLADALQRCGFPEASLSYQAQ